MKAKDNKQTFTQLIVLRNPASTNIKLSDKHIAELQNLFPNVPYEVVETMSSAPETYARLHALGSRLGPKTLLCVAGGDGTANLVVEFLLGDRSLSKTARHTVLLPLWAGNASDLAHMANGPVFRMRLPALFASGNVIPVYPLECRLTDASGHTHTYHAVSYAGFGVTAAIAKAINAREHRSRWWQRLNTSRIFGELVTVWRTLLGSSGFTIKEGNKEYSLYERSYINGTRMAKLQPFAASLTEKHFIQTTVSKKDKHIFAFYRWLSGSIRPAPTRKTRRASTFTTEDTIWMHVDGEPIRVQRGTQVTVRCSRTPVYMLATRLPRIRTP